MKVSRSTPGGGVPSRQSALEGVEVGADNASSGVSLPVLREPFVTELCKKIVKIQPFEMAVVFCSPCFDERVPENWNPLIKAWKYLNHVLSGLWGISWITTGPL